MNDISRNEITAVLRQHLETEQMLGVAEVPLPPAPKTAGAPAAQRTAHGAALQALSEAERAERTQRLRTLDEEHVKGCTKCHLSETRTNTVFGQGSPAARVVFVGEAPGHDEDMQGLAFVGKAGQLLTRMIAAMGLSRDEVFICNVLKCRPPGNRTPATDEIAACSPYLLEQLQTLRPEVIVALGGPAAQTLLRTKEGITRLRGRFHDFYLSGTPLVGEAVPLMPTFHPAYLLRSPQEKGKAWEDLMQVMDRLGLPIPEQYRKKE